MCLDPLWPLTAKCTCAPKPPPESCAESVRLRAELATAWAEAYRLRWAASEVKLSPARDTVHSRNRRIEALEGIAIGVILVGAASAAACVKWLVS